MPRGHKALAADAGISRPPHRVARIGSEVDPVSATKLLSAGAQKPKPPDPGIIIVSSPASVPDEVDRREGG